jgi:hypothetical protein
MKANLTQTELNIPNEFLDNITIKENVFFDTLDGVASDTTAPQFKADLNSPLNLSEGPAHEQGPSPINPNTEINLQSIVSGELAVNLMNSFIPVILCYGARQFMDLDINKKAFSLNAAERNTLAPILDRCLAQMNVSFENPWNALIISMATIYGGKFFEAVNDPELSTQVKKSGAKVAAKVQASVTGTNDGGPVTFNSTRKPGETRGRKPKNRG